jgi:glycosyltransferase involved in cell wall biosynthesis
VNQYPAASHSFIRREIRAVEQDGTEVFRFSIRPVDANKLPDAQDQDELRKTSVLLNRSLTHLAAAALKAVIGRPRRALQGLRAAFSRPDWRPLELAKRAAYFAEAALLSQHITDHKIDHIHAHFGTNPAAVARIASKISDITFSFTIHGPDEFDAPVQLDLREKISDSAFCVAISSYGRSQLMRWSAYHDWAKIFVVRCGVDDSFLALENTQPPPDAPELCTVARLSGQKGVPLLLDAAARLADQGQNFRLTILGDGEMRAELEAMIERHGLQGRVVLTGWASSETVITHLRQARAMVLPSFAEGLPVVIMEALSLRRPVITTAIAGIPELVDSNCGWLVPAGDIEALTFAMAEALTAPTEKLEQMGRIGLERVAKLHDASMNGKALNDLFKSVIPSNG